MTQRLLAIRNLTKKTKEEPGRRRRSEKALVGGTGAMMREVLALAFASQNVPKLASFVIVVANFGLFF